MKLIRLTESELHKVIKKCINTVIKESASSKLYHFLNFYMFENIINTDSFTPTNVESKWHNGKNTMSFSRTKTFEQKR